MGGRCDTSLTAARYAAGPHVVRLAPDVATAFPSDTAVNAALRRCLCDAAGRPVRGVDRWSPRGR